MVHGILSYKKWFKIIKENLELVFVEVQVLIDKIDTIIKFTFFFLVFEDDWLNFVAIWLILKRFVSCLIQDDI